MPHTPRISRKWELHKAFWHYRSSGRAYSVVDSHTLLTMPIIKWNPDSLSEVAGWLGEPFGREGDIGFPPSTIVGSHNRQLLSITVLISFYIRLCGETVCCVGVGGITEGLKTLRRKSTPLTMSYTSIIDNYRIFIKKHFCLT